MHLLLSFVSILVFILRDINDIYAKRFHQDVVEHLLPLSFIAFQHIYLKKKQKHTHVKKELFVYGIDGEKKIIDQTIFITLGKQIFLRLFRFILISNTFRNTPIKTRWYLWKTISSWSATVYCLSLYLLTCRGYDQCNQK